MKKKTYKYKSEWGDTYTLAFVKHNYANNGSLALELVDVEEKEPFAFVTVNLPYSNAVMPNQQFVDINELPNICEWLEENKIAKRVNGATATSGFCTYPLYEFDLTKI
jgi:hypothetical protein